MKSFGVSESLILAGTALITTSRITEGWVLLGLGLFTSFVRYTTWFGMQNKDVEN